MLPSFLQSAIYSCPRRTSQFLESVSVSTTQTIMTLNKTHNKSQNFLPFSPSGVVRLTCWESATPVYLWFTAAVASGFCAIIATQVSCLNDELQTMWARFVHGPTQVVSTSCLPRVHLVSTSCPPRVHLVSTSCLPHVYLISTSCLLLTSHTW